MLEVNKFAALPAWYERLKDCGLPVLIYGMGNGCEKVLAAFEENGIKCSGIFASDDFVRGKEFKGFPVTTLQEAEKRFADFAVVCAFGTSLPEIMQRIDRIAEKHLLVCPDTAVAGNEYFRREKLLELRSEAEKVYSLLADELSRRTFENVLKFKLTGEKSYLSKVFCDPEDPYKVLSLEKDEIYCDLGAYTGDTIIEFLSHTGGSYRRIYALEPSRKNFAKCVKNTMHLDNTFIINAAALDSDSTLCFSDGAGRQQAVSDSGRLCAARSLDSVLRGGECTYIKYDVEGADRSALLGSRETIQKNCPKIRTAVYHRPYDIITLPLLLHELQPEYRFYLRQQRYYPAWETELIAIK